MGNTTVTNSKENVNGTGGRTKSMICGRRCDLSEPRHRGDTGEIDRVVLLAAWADGPPEKLKSRKLFIVSRDDTRGHGAVRPLALQCLR